MSRMEKAPEPSMEDILASIRRIISDDDQATGHDRSLSAMRQARDGHAASRNDAYQASTSQADTDDSEDEIFDLTDDFAVSESERQQAEAPTSAPGTTRSLYESATAPQEDALQKVARALNETKQRDFPASGQAAVETVAAPPMEPSLPTKPPPSAARAPAPTSPAVKPPVRPSWSRRDLPYGPPSSRPGAEPAAVRTPPSSRPSQLFESPVKIPVPDSGPVPLAEAAAKASEMPKDVTNAVAALAQSAAHALNDRELAQASGIDFDAVDGGKKAAITESIANAIAQPAASDRETRGPYESNVLDQVLSRNFLRQDAKPVEQAEAQERVQPAKAQQPEAAAAPSAKPDPRAAQIQPQTAPVKQVEVPAVPQQPQPPVTTQAQFVGVAERAVPTGQGRSLEDSVREMLRPMLTAWLNENMPRILEDAIRQEIASRGIGGLIPHDKQ
jgi:cell pole-organizing protein PopZ